MVWVEPWRSKAEEKWGAKIKKTNKKGEKEYHFLQASNLSWNMKSIMEAYTARWLIEVFIEDWSCYNTDFAVWPNSVALRDQSDLWFWAYCLTTAFSFISINKSL